MSCLKWNLFRFGTKTWITYLLNEHAASLHRNTCLTLSCNKVTPCFSCTYWNESSSYFCLGVIFFSSSPSFLVTGDKINNLTSTQASHMLDVWVLLLWIRSLKTDRFVQRLLRQSLRSSPNKGRRRDLFLFHCLLWNALWIHTVSSLYVIAAQSWLAVPKNDPQHSNVTKKNKRSAHEVP